jgi:hypothetical protein
MHRATLAGAQRRTGSARSGRSRTRTLKNWLAGNRTSWRGACARRGCVRLSDWYARPRRRSFVNRARSSLRHDHARRGRGRCCRSSRCSRTWWCRRSRRSTDRRRRRRRRRDHCRRWRRCCGTRRCGRGGCCRRRRSGGLLCGRSHSRARRRHSRGWCWRRSYGRLRRRSRNRGLRGRRRNDRRTRRDSRFRGRRCGFLLLRDRLQHISRTRDVRQINLGFDFFFAAQGTRRLR